MRKNIKTSLLATAGLAVLALPVAAGQNMAKLRGAFTGHHLGADSSYVYSNPVCTDCGTTWQQRRLRQKAHSNFDTVVTTPDYNAPQYVKTTQSLQYHPAPAYVAPSTTSAGLRGLSAPGGVQYSKAAANAFYQDAGHTFDVGGLNVRTSVAHSNRMLDWDENVTGQAVTLLANRATNVLKPNSLYLGGGIKGGFMYQRTDVPGAFPILSRFPFFSPSTDQEAGVFAINNAALSFTSTFGDWTTFYGQMEYSETEYAPDQDELQLRKAYVVFGNLQKSPFYAAFGRKTVDFGNFDTYNAFTHNEGAHYFWTVSDQPVLELGYYKNGLKLTGTAFSAGRQLRTAWAGEQNNIGNYAFNAEKEFRFGKCCDTKALTIGGGYLHDTIYRSNWTAHTFQGILNGNPPLNHFQYRNSAVNGFVEYNSDFFDAMVEYTTTLKPWAAAIPQNADGFVDPAYLIDPLGTPNDIDNVNFDEKLSVLVAQARIKPMVGGKRMSIAATGSWGNIGDDFVGVGLAGQPTTWINNQQHAFSVEYPISPNLDIGAEYVYNKGFIPFVAPQLVSNDDVNAHAINIGFKARF